MRTASPTELALLAAATCEHHHKVEVQNENRTWKNLTSLSGIDWVDGWEIDGENIDRPVATAKLELRRDVTSGNKSLAPLWEASPLNVNNSGSYAPLLELGRGVRISTAVTASGVAPVSGDWKEMFLGRIDAIAWEQSPIVVECSDQYAWIVDRQIEDEGPFGSDLGESLEDIIDDVLTAWPPKPGVPTLYAPVSPGWVIPTAFNVSKKAVSESLKDLVDQIGWDLCYRYDASDVCQLTLLEPPRSKTVSDATISPSMYRAVRKLDLDIQAIRNKVKVTIIDASGTADFATDADPASQTAYGIRFMEMPGGSNIVTNGEALTLAQAVVSDLKQAKAEQEVELYYFWPAQKYDLYTFPANSDHYDVDQQLAVVGVRHTAKNGEIITTLTCRGSVAGSYTNWLVRGKTGGDPNYVAPKITVHWAETSSLGTLTITIDDPQDRVSLVEAQTVTAGGSPSSWGTLTPVSSVYTQTVSITAGLLSSISYRIKAVDSDGQERYIDADTFIFGSNLGPSLVVTPTPGPTSYSISYTPSSGVLLSIDGGAYSAASASPIVVPRSAAGSPGSMLTFKTTLNGQTVTDAVFVPAIDQDTVSPDLDVPAGTTTDTTVILTPSCSNPAGGSAPTLQITMKGTSATSGGGAVTYADGTTTTIASGTAITVNRPAFSNTGIQATVTFRAFLSGGGMEEISRTILNQVQTSFGPSLEVVPTVHTTDVSIAYTYTGTITASVDGGAFGAPGSASPWVYPRDASGGSTHTITFKCVKDAQTVTTSVQVPPQDASTSSSTFSSLSVTTDDSGDYFDVSWSYSGPSVGSFAVEGRKQGIGAATPVSLKTLVTGLSSGTSTYTSTTGSDWLGEDLDNGSGTRSATWYFRVIAYDSGGGTEIARSAEVSSGTRAYFP